MAKAYICRMCSSTLEHFWTVARLFQGSRALHLNLCSIIWNIDCRSLFCSRKVNGRNTRSLLISRRDLGDFDARWYQTYLISWFNGTIRVRKGTAMWSKDQMMLARAGRQTEPSTKEIRAVGNFRGKKLRKGHVSWSALFVYGWYTRYFAAEIIGNLLDVEPRRWRRPRRIDFSFNSEQVATFRAKYDKYDWTGMINSKI